MRDAGGVQIVAGTAARTAPAGGACISRPRLRRRRAVLHQRSELVAVDDEARRVAQRVREPL